MSDGFISALGALLIASGVLVFVTEKSGATIPFLVFGLMFLLWGLMAGEDEEVIYR